MEAAIKKSYLGKFSDFVNFQKALSSFLSILLGAMLLGIIDGNLDQAEQFLPLFYAIAAVWAVVTALYNLRNAVIFLEERYMKLVTFRRSLELERINK